MAVTVRILPGPLDDQACSPLGLLGPGRGALASFLGVVRNHAHGRAVSGLFYECYMPMAERILTALAWETVAQIDDGLEVLVTHGTGVMVPGQVSVAIHAASAHRAQAFSATRHIIERIKQDLPIWKRQTFVDGSSEWVQGS